MKQSHRTGWPIKVGALILAGVLFSAVVLPTANVAQARTDGYNSCSSKTKYIVGAVIIGFGLGHRVGKKDAKSKIAGK